MTLLAHLAEILFCLADRTPDEPVAPPPRPLGLPVEAAYVLLVAALFALAWLASRLL